MVVRNLLEVLREDFEKEEVLKFDNLFLIELMLPASFGKNTTNLWGASLSKINELSPA